MLTTITAAGVAGCVFVVADFCFREAGFFPTGIVVLSGFVFFTWRWRPPFRDRVSRPMLPHACAGWRSRRPPASSRAAFAAAQGFRHALRPRWIAWLRRDAHQ